MLRSNKKAHAQGPPLKCGYREAIRISGDTRCMGSSLVTCSNYEAVSMSEKVSALFFSDWYEVGAYWRGGTFPFLVAIPGLDVQGPYHIGSCQKSPSKKIPKSKYWGVP